MRHGNFDTEKVSVTFSCVRIFYFSRKLQSSYDLINAASQRPEQSCQLGQAGSAGSVSQRGRGRRRERGALAVSGVQWPSPCRGLLVPHLVRWKPHVSQGLSLTQPFIPSPLLGSRFGRGAEWLPRAGLGSPMKLSPRKERSCLAVRATGTRGVCGRSLVPMVLHTSHFPMVLWHKCREGPPDLPLITR